MRSHKRTYGKSKPPVEMENEKEAERKLFFVLSEIGYKVFDIPKLTYVEIEDILKGQYEVNKERKRLQKMESG